MSTTEKTDRQNIQILDEMFSPKLLDIVKVTNQRSVNLFAQSLGHMAMQKNGLEDDIIYWEDRGIDMIGCRTSDFAGLAPDNAITSKAMVKILAWVQEDSNRFEEFKSTLAIAGESGTLRSLLRNSPSRGHIFAKSGLIAGVRSYAGYVHRPDGRWIAFSILTHNPSCGGQVVRKKLAQLMETMYLST